MTALNRNSQETTKRRSRNIFPRIICPNELIRIVSVYRCRHEHNAPEQDAFLSFNENRCVVWGEIDETHIDYSYYDKQEFELPGELLDESKLLTRYTGNPGSYMDISFLKEIQRLKSIKS